MGSVDAVLEKLKERGVNIEQLNNKSRNSFLKSANYKKHIQEAQYLYYQKKRQNTFNKIKEYFDEFAKGKEIVYSLTLLQVWEGGAEVLGGYTKIRKL